MQYIILKFTKTVFIANKWSSTYFCPDLSEGISFEDLEKVFTSTFKINHKLSKTSLLPWPEWRRGHRCHKRRVSRPCVGAGDTWGCSAGWRTWDRGHTWTAAPCCGHDCVSGGRPSQRTAYHTPCTPHCGSVKKYHIQSTVYSYFRPSTLVKWFCPVLNSSKHSRCKRDNSVLLQTTQS